MFLKTDSAIMQKGEPMRKTLNEDDVLKEIDRWIGYLDEDMITRIKIGIKKLPSAHPEQRWIPCGKCIHADGKNRWCKVLDRTINEDYFCSWAEPWKEGADE